MEANQLMRDAIVRKNLRIGVLTQRVWEISKQRDELLAVVEQLVEIGELANEEYDRQEPQAHLFSMVERLQNLDDEARTAIAKAREE